jgi:hypothetical protein
MYAHSFFVTSVRGSGELPTTGASCALGVIGFMNAALGTLLVPDFFLAVFLEDFLAVFFLAAGRFFAELFFFAFAIASPGC